MIEKEYPYASDVVRKAIEEMGDIEAWRRQNAVFDASGRRFDQEQEHEALLEKYTYKWVAVNADGLLGVYDTIDEAFDTLDDLGLGRSDYFLNYLDPLPSNPTNVDAQEIHYIGYRRGVTMTEKERSDTLELVKKVIEDEGGIEACRRQDEVFAAAGRRFDQEHKALLEKHPYKWVAVDAGGLLGVYDTIDEALDILDNMGLRRDDYFLKYLDPRPMII